MSLRRDVGLTFASQLGVLGISLATGVICARTLGPDGKGSIFLLMLDASLLVTLGGLSAPYTDACLWSRDTGDRNSLMGYTLAVVAFVAVLAPVFYAVAKLAGVDPLGLVATPYAALVLVVAPVDLLTSCCRGMLQGGGRFGCYNVVDLLGASAYLLSMAVFVALLRLGLAFAVLGWVGARILVAVYAVWSVRGLGGWPPAFRWKRLRDYAGFGLQVYLGGLVGLLNQRVDALMVRTYLGVADIGHYSVAVRIAELLFFLPTAVGAASLPRLASNRSDASSLTATGLRVAFLLGVPALLGLLLASPLLIVVLYGPRFLPAVLPTVLLLPGAFMYGFAHLTTPYFAATLAKPYICASLSLLSLLVEAAAAFLLIPRLGLAGAALASSMGYASGILGHLLVFKRLSGFSWREALAIRPEDIAAIQESLRRGRGHLPLLRGAR